MRPRKVILLIDEHEISLSTTRYLLDNKGFRVLSASNAAEAIEIASSRQLDLIVLRESGNVAAQASLSLELKDMQAESQILFVGKSAQPLANAPYFDFFLRSTAPPIELVERCKLLVARKRGPRKKPVGSVGVHADVTFIRGCA